MKNLWTPWRMAYIEEKSPLEKGCIFEAGSGKNYEKDSLLLYRDSLIVVLLNRFPYANGNLLIAPSCHVVDICDLNENEKEVWFDMNKE